MKTLSFLSKGFFGLVALLLLYHTAGATIYYMSSSAQAQASFPTLNLQPGDQVLFKRGETFFGAFLVNQNGTAANPIVIGAYGLGARPVISGFTYVYQWTSLGNGIWESNVLPTTDGQDVNVVVIGGVEYAMGRYPNTTAANSGWLNYEAHTATTLTDNQQTFTADWAGAEVVLRTHHSNIARTAVTAASGNVLSYEDFGPDREPTDGWGYFLQRSPKTLDQFGEWYYNPTTTTLQVYFGNKSPEQLMVKVSTTDILLQPRAAYITVQNLVFTGANTYGVYNDWTNSGHQYLNCSFTFCGIDGLNIINKTNVLVDGCTFDHNNSNGLSIGYHSANARIANCTFDHTGLLIGMLKENTQGRCGYALFSSSFLGEQDFVVENNRFLHTGYIGLFFDHNNNLVQHNFFDSSCMVLDDGAAMYTSNYTGVGQTPAVNYNNRILNNIAQNSVGAPLGCPGNNNMAHCYYIDDWGNHITFIGNTGTRAGHSGIYIHNANTNTITDNLFYDNQQFQVYMQDDGIDRQHYSIHDNDIEHNQLYAASASQQVYYLASEDQNISSFGIIDNNWVAAPFSSAMSHTDVFGTGGAYYKFNTTSQWNQFGYDLQSSGLPAAVTITSPLQVNLRYNAGAQQITRPFCSQTFYGLKGDVFTDGLTLQPWTSTLQIAPKAPPVVSVKATVTTNGFTVMLYKDGQPMPADRTYYIWVDYVGHGASNQLISAGIQVQIDQTHATAAYTAPGVTNGMVSASVAWINPGDSPYQGQLLLNQ